MGSGAVWRLLWPNAGPRSSCMGETAPAPKPWWRRGTVNLIGSGRDKTHEGGSHEGLCPSGHGGDLGPGLEGLGPGGSIRVGGEVIAAEVEQVADLVVSGEEALRLAS
jgi:hypothetical protein